MNKVMTRAQRRPGTRPPGRRDTRRPGGAPPRAPGGSPARITSDGRPPGSPRGSGPARTGPTDNRPPTAPGRRRAATADPARPYGPYGPPRSGPAEPGGAQGRAASAVAASAAAAPAPAATDLFADRLLAVLSGQRPVHWMLRHTAGEAYDELARLAERGPLRTRGARPVVRDIGYYEPRPGALEVFARIGAGRQLRAMAFRLERGRDRRWRCTAVELGIPRVPHPQEA
ncbi:Rv3235 family protein [Streptomyces sp. NRRL S-340]|uniref:Rv3235 family protein n=1 Tax=Streptomyces sp. NRRL S-340 TaxID=1463901 RepID=UPI00055E7EB7|nr:Rv3235 family protein [Streptomyces sp. NRRL S-340]